MYTLWPEMDSARNFGSGSTKIGFCTPFKADFWLKHAFPILHVAEMWKQGDNNLIQVALVFIPFRQGK